MIRCEAYLAISPTELYRPNYCNCLIMQFMQLSSKRFCKPNDIKKCFAEAKCFRSKTENKLRLLAFLTKISTNHSHLRKFFLKTILLEIVVLNCNCEIKKDHQMYCNMITFGHSLIGNTYYTIHTHKPMQEHLIKIFFKYPQHKQINNSNTCYCC